MKKRKQRKQQKEGKTKKTKNKWGREETKQCAKESNPCLRGQLAGAVPLSYMLFLA